jgi:hypothetical protein
MHQGRYVHVYLDEKSVAAAESLGGGNISEGIRQALISTMENFGAITALLPFHGDR